MKDYSHLNNIDIFTMLGIVDQYGNKLTNKNINPLMGYQIVHVVTGKFLPHTQKHEIMGKDYATKKLLSITEFYSNNNQSFPFDEYYFEPVYMSELEIDTNGFLLLYSEIDEKEMSE